MKDKEKQLIAEKITKAVDNLNKVLIECSSDEIKQACQPEIRKSNKGHEYVHVKLGLYEVKEIVDTNKIEVEREKKLRAKKVKGKGGEIVDFSDKKDT